MEHLRPDLETASGLYEMLKETDTWYAAVSGDTLLDLQKEPIKGYLAAFDIGTTTVVGYLTDARTGRVLAVESSMNPQAQYGADVIMRANYALENGTENLSSCIRQTVQTILDTLAEKSGISTGCIYQTLYCRQHLYASSVSGHLPGALVHAPYNPAISQLLFLKASEYDLHIHPKGQLILLPDVAGFVGADTMAVCSVSARISRRRYL